MTKISRIVLFLLFCLHAGVPLLWSETGKVLVLVLDLQNKPVRGVEIGIEGAGGSGVSKDDGKAWLSLSKDTNENDPISLYVLRSPPGKNWVILPPKERTVPSFKNKAENVIRVVVVERGNLAKLSSPTALRAITEEVNKKNGRQRAESQTSLDDSTTLSVQIQARANKAP